METLKVLKDQQGKYIKLYGTVYRLVEEPETPVVESIAKEEIVLKKKTRKDGK